MSNRDDDNNSTNDDAPVDFIDELNDLSIGDDYAPAAPPSTPQRVKRRVVINTDANETQEIEAVGKKKSYRPAVLDRQPSNNKSPIDAALKDLKNGAVTTADSTTTGTSADPDYAEKQDLLRQIESFKKQLFVTGSGNRFTVFNSLEQIRAERDLCNNQVNERRGHKTMKGAILLLTPFIEKVIDKAVPKERFDVTSNYTLTQEIEENWEAMFAEPMTQIAILHAKWFAVSPYSEIAHSAFACASSCDAKNQTIRCAEKSPTPSAPNTPETATTTDSADDDDVLQ